MHAVFLTRSRMDHFQTLFPKKNSIVGVLTTLCHIYWASNTLSLAERYDHVLSIMICMRKVASFLFTYQCVCNSFSSETSLIMGCFGQTLEALGFNDLYLDFLQHDYCVIRWESYMAMYRSIHDGQPMRLPWPGTWNAHDHHTRSPVDAENSAPESSPQAPVQDELDSTCDFSQNDIHQEFDWYQEFPEQEGLLGFGL